MAITNGTGSFNIGRDCTITLIGPFGEVTIPNVTAFNCKQETANVTVDRLDGVQLRAQLPKGWTGSFTAARGGPQLDNLFAAIEASWYNAGVVSASTLYQRIVNPDSTVSTFQFDNVALQLDDGGTWKGDAEVSQSVSFSCNRRTPV